MYTCEFILEDVESGNDLGSVPADCPAYAAPWLSECVSGGHGGWGVAGWGGVDIGKAKKEAVPESEMRVLPRDSTPNTF